MLFLRASAWAALVGSALGVSQFSAVNEELDASGGYSYNVSLCPGYNLTSSSSSDTSTISGTLALAGAPCNAFGTDIPTLSLSISYLSPSSVRILISSPGSNSTDFPVPAPIIARPDTLISADSSQLVVNYTSSPFTISISRKSDPPGTLPLFTTSPTYLPPTPIPPISPSTDNTTSLPSFPLIYSSQYLQLSTALPPNANIYGLGEIIASSGFRRDPNSTIGTLWARDVADPIDANEYGSHPFWLEHRLAPSTGTYLSHGVFLATPAGADYLLRPGVLEWRLLRGPIELFVFAGPTAGDVMAQYSEIIGKPIMPPYWALGFHLCRWGYKNLSETAAQVTSMRAASIPLETIWNDIDLYLAYRDFTSDPTSFNGAAMREFIRNLTANHQHYIPIVDAAVAKSVNASDVYDPYTQGTEMDVFIKNPDGTEYIGQVWPGYTVFPDWFANNTQAWWTQALKNWSASGVEFSGIWLDMNEASSFCDGSCGTGIDIRNTTPPFILPGLPGGEVTQYPEGYNSTLSGPSGNITVNGTLTYGTGTGTMMRKRAISEEDINVPPYAIHNGNGRLSLHALATNATHAGGIYELEVHNLWGTMEEHATYNSLLDMNPGKRPFLISRSTFSGAGKWTGHWLGDNYSLWQYMYLSIQGVLQFQLFGIPMVGADTCGFNGNTDEELCNRWMQLAAFTPFYRNHNIMGAISQEPYRWDSVANASRIAIAARYSLLPYWYTLLANATMYALPTVRALWYEFPQEPELFGIDRQFMVGSSILVTPVLEPNVSSVAGIFPGRGSVIWRDWWTHAEVDAALGGNTTLDAPLGHINVHIRDSSILLLHQEPGYTTVETRSGPFSLLVSLNANWTATGSAYIDDGESWPLGASSTLSFSMSHDGTLTGTRVGNYTIAQTVDTITILGLPLLAYPDGQDIFNQILVNGYECNGTTSYMTDTKELSATGCNLDLNGDWTVKVDPPPMFNATA